LPGPNQAARTIAAPEFRLNRLNVEMGSDRQRQQNSGQCIL